MLIENKKCLISFALSGQIGRFDLLERSSDILLDEFMTVYYSAIRSVSVPGP